MTDPATGAGPVILNVMPRILSSILQLALMTALLAGCAPDLSRFDVMQLLHKSPGSALELRADASGQGAVVAARGSTYVLRNATLGGGVGRRPGTSSGNTARVGLPAPTP
jgi:hypothetical protein